MRALSVLLIIATVILVAAATRSGSGYRSDGYKSGEYRSGGYRSDGYRSGGYRSGGYRSGGYRSGGYRSGGYRSGGHRSGGYRTGGYRTGGYGYGYGGYKKVQCPKLSDPANGSVEQTGTVLGSRATYSCNKGFVLVGNEKRVCSRYGKWSGEAPICKPVDCGHPDPADPNGSLEVSSTTFGSRALYKCNPGFTIVGKGVSFCLANGEWSNDAPECRPVDCGKLPSPKNGRVTFHPGTTFQSTATFTCRRGFKLSGSKVRTCQASGSWSGVQPTCIRITCPKVSPPRYGKVYASGYYPGNRLRYRCRYGYRLDGPRKRVCLPSGHWDGKDSKCVKNEHEYGYPQKYPYRPSYGGY